MRLVPLLRRFLIPGLHATREVAADIVFLSPAAAFLFLSLIPGQALAFASYAEQAHQPLQFVRDASLQGSAVVGIEAFPKARTVGGLLHSRASTIPTASKHLQPGMAIRVLATAYSSTPDQTDGNPFITASGTTVHPGTLAANFLPFGAKVRIGNTIYTVEDRMNSRYNDKYIVDIWHADLSAARQFGARVVEVEIVSLPEK